MFWLAKLTPLVPSFARQNKTNLPIIIEKRFCWSQNKRKSVPLRYRGIIRTEHIKRLCDDLLKGKRRPCCWPKCPHRRESAKKWFKWLSP